jgi:hypothetical protein
LGHCNIRQPDCAIALELCPPFGAKGHASRRNPLHSMIGNMMEKIQIPREKEYKVLESLVFYPLSARFRNRFAQRNVRSVEIHSAPDIRHRIMFDPGHGLEERLI